MIPGPLKSFVLTFLRQKGVGGQKFEAWLLPSDGSDRKFWRIRPSEASETYVVMASPITDPHVQKENTAYFMIGTHMRQKGIPVPKIFDWDKSSGYFILEDLGDQNLQDYVSWKDPLHIYPQVITQLIHMQVYGVMGFDPSWCCQTETYDKAVMLTYESFYFKRAFLHHYLNIEVQNGHHLDKSLEYLASKASKAEARFLMHRDFQSRNIMVTAKGIGILDWQGARLGPLGYDLASILIDPYTNLPHHIKEDLFAHYLSLVREIDAALVQEVEETYPYLALQRNLQVLGAFSFLTEVKNRPHFQQYIPLALDSLKNCLEGVNDSRLDPLLEIVSMIDLTRASGMVTQKNSRHPQKQ